MLPFSLYVENFDCGTEKRSPQDGDIYYVNGPCDTFTRLTQPSIRNENHKLGGNACYEQVLIFFVSAVCTVRM